MRETGFDNFSKALANGDLSAGRIISAGLQTARNFTERVVAPLATYDPSRRRAIAVGAGALLSLTGIPSGLEQLTSILGPNKANAQEVPTPTPGLPSESPLVPEQGKNYTTLANRTNDEQRYLIDNPEILIDGTSVQPGDCLEVIEAIDTVTQVQGGPDHITYRHLFQRCTPESKPVEVPAQSETCIDYEFETGPWRKDGLSDSFVGHGDFWIDTNQGLVRTFDVGQGSGLTGHITEIIPNGQSFSAHGDYGVDLYCNRNASIRNLNIAQGDANLRSQGKTPIVNVLEFNTSTGTWDFHPRSQ